MIISSSSSSSSIIVGAMLSGSYLQFYTVDNL